MAEGWRIVSQRQETAINPGGGFEDVMRINFETFPSNLHGTIEVPLRQYSTDNVKSLIEGRARIMEQVQEL